MGWAYNFGILILIVSYVYFQIMNKGPRLSFKCSLLNMGCPKQENFKLSDGSSFDPKFEKVVEEFKENFIKGEEIGAQLSFWYKGKNVINISGGNRNIEKNQPMELSSLQMVYSSSKSICNLVVAMLVDRGLVKYEDKIASFWPEFGVKDKEDVTVSDLLQHKAGLVMPETKITFDELRDQDELAVKLARQPHYFVGRKETAYSPVLIGHYVNEIVRRVDPQKRSIDVFVEEEINKKLGVEFYFCLTSDQYENRMGHIYTYPLIKTLDLVFKTLVLEPIKLKLGYKPDPGLELFRALLDDTHIMARGFKIYQKEVIIELVNEFETNTLLIPGASMKSNAFSIGKVAALIANGGEIDGVRLLSKDVLDKALEIQQEVYDKSIGKNFKRTTGGWAYFDSQFEPSVIRGNTNYTGWQGFGGSVFYWNSQKNFGVGYVMNSMGAPNRHVDPRAAGLISSFYELIEKYEKDEKSEEIK